MDESAAPLAAAWFAAQAAHRRPLQIPGHKNRYSAPTSDDALGADLLRPLVRDDIPLQGGVDDNAFSNRYLEQAEARWSAAVQADHSRFVVGGSTQGNIAALAAVTRPGEPVAVDRTSHRSTQSALVISGARPQWVFPQIHPEFGLPIGVSSTLDIPSGVTALFVTSPSYVGTLSDVAGLADASHRVGIPLVVDQAWGAHLGFIDGMGASALGADVVVTSVHKTLMGYSQTAVVTMIEGLVARQHVDRCVDLVQTTSPSGTLLASIDATRAVLEHDKGVAIERLIESVASMRRRLARIPGLVVLNDEIALMDPFKVTLWLPRTGASGFRIGADLTNLGHSPEAADRDTVVLTMTLLDEPEFFEEATAILTGLVEKYRGESREPAPAELWSIEPEVVISPRDAFFAKRRRIALADAAGEVSAEQFCPYPPGVPLLAPGERVTAETISAITRAGEIGRVAYSSDPSLRTIEVVDA